MESRLGVAGWNRGFCHDAPSWQLRLGNERPIPDIMFVFFEIIFGKSSKSGKPHLEDKARIEPGSNP